MDGLGRRRIHCAQASTSARLTLQTAPYVIFFDVDNLMTVPLSCSMAFDEAGKPITRLCVRARDKHLTWSAGRASARAMTV